MNPANSYTAAEAIRAILDRVRTYDEQLAERIEHAIDMGKDIREEESVASSGRGRKRKRKYRKHVSLSDEEALHVAYQVLMTHFYVLPLVVNSACSEFAESSVGSEKSLSKPTSAPVEWQYGREPDDALRGKEKAIEIEIETETTQLKEQSPNRPLSAYATEEINEMKSLLDRLRTLIE